MRRRSSLALVLYCIIQKQFPGSLITAAMEKKQGKLSFSITTQRRRLIKPLACLADEGTGSRSTPAPQFITEFGPSETVNPAATPAIVVAPLPNFHLFRREPCDGPSRKPAIIKEEGIVFTREADDNPRSSSHAAYGLNLPSATATATDKKESDKAPPHHQVTVTSSELLRRRFKQDIAALSDHRETEEYPKFSAKAFAAAVLAGYGWSEGQGIGRNNKKKGDTKVFSCGRRPGTGAQRQTFGLGYNPEIISGAGKKRKRQDTDTREQDRVSSVRPRRG